MNAGAYGGEMRQVIARVDCFDMQGNPVSFSREELNFAHRHSVLQERPWRRTPFTLSLRRGTVRRFGRRWQS